MLLEKLLSCGGGHPSIYLDDYGLIFLGFTVLTSIAAVDIESVHLAHQGLAETRPMALDLAGVGTKQGKGTLCEAAARRPQSRIHSQGWGLAGVGHIHQTGTYGKQRKMRVFPHLLTYT